MKGITYLSAFRNSLTGLKLPQDQHREHSCLSPELQCVGLNVSNVPPPEFSDRLLQSPVHSRLVELSDATPGSYNEPAFQHACLLSSYRF